MGLPARSQADPSRGPRPVEAPPPAVDERVSPILGVAAPALDEPVSPELALVDPELAARLRERLPEIELEPPETLEPEAPAEATVHPLRPALAVLDGNPGAAEDVVAADFAAAGAVPPSGDRSDVKRLVTAFLAGAAAAAVVTTGVIAEMSETDTFRVDSGTVPPTTTASGTSQPTNPAPTTQAPRPAVPQATKNAQGTTKAPAATKPKAGASAKESAARAQRRAVNRAQRQASAQAAKQAAASAQASKSASKQKKSAQTSSKASKTPARAAAEPRRFAWAPVDGASGYRIEIFRGDEQILQVTTKTSSYAVPATWRHRGHAESLSAGSYRWYVWPVLPDGPAPKASVQARLTVP